MWSRQQEEVQAITAPANTFPHRPREARLTHECMAGVNRMLHDGPQAERSASVVCDGRSNDGVRVPAGIYFYRLQHGQETEADVRRRHSQR